MGLTKTQSGGLEDQSVTLDKLPHGDGSTDGKFLRANNGADPTFESIPAGVGGSTGVDFNDNVKARFGTGNDLEIYHDGTDSHIYHSTAYPYNDLKIRSTADIKLQTNNSEDAVVCNVNGAVELYHDNNKKLETTSYGALVSGELQATGANFTDDGQSSPVVSVKTDDDNPWGLQVGNSTYSDNAQHGWNVFVNNSGEVFNYNIGSSSYNDWNWYLSNSSASKQMMKFESSSLAVELYHDNSKKFETTSSGTSVNGNLVCGSVTLSGGGLALSDNDQVVFGSGDDAFIKHTGSDFLIENDTGSFNIKCTSGTGVGEGIIYFGSGNGTTRTVLQSDGHFRPYADAAYYLGTSSYRWLNIYTADLNLSNEGLSNDVDGTWGSWTIQEGESDLFLKNNRSGKKYKFNLTEVS